MAERIGIEVSLTGAEAVLAKLREIDAFGNKIDGKTYTAKLGVSQAKAAESIRRTTKALTGQETAYRGVAAISQSAIKNADRLVKSLRGMKDFKWAEEPIGVLGNVKTVQNEVKRAIDGVNRSIEKEHHQFRQLGKENRKIHDEMENMSDEEKALANKRIALNTKERNAIRERIGDLREQKTTLGNYNRELTNEYGRIQKIYDAQKSLNKAEEARWKAATERHDRMWNYQDLSRGRRAVTGGRARLSGITNTPSRLRTPLAIDAAEQAALKAHEERVQAIKRAYNGISGTMSRVGASVTTLGNTLTRITSPFDSIARGAAYTIGYGAVNKVTSGLASGFARYDIMKQYGLTMANFSKKNYDASDSIKELDLSVRGLPTGLDEIVNMAQRFTMTAGSMREGTKLAIATNRAFLASMSTDSQKYQGMLQLQDVIGGKKMQSREWSSLVASMPFAVREIGKSLGYSGKELDKWVGKVQQGKVANKEFLKGLKKAGGENGTLKKYADFTKQTWGAFTQNIGNAFSRMTAGVLTALDGVTKIMTNGKFDSLNSFLADSFIPAIDQTTEKVKDWIAANPDKIIGFFNKLKSIDWAGFGEGMLTGVNGLLEMMGKLYDLFGGNTFEIGKWMVKLNVLGRIISTLGMFTKGLAPFGGLAGVLTKILAGKKLAQLFSGLKSIGKAKGAVEGAETIGKVGTALSGATLSWQGVASKALNVAMLPAAAWSMYKVAKALQEFDKLNLSWGLAGKVAAGMAAVGAFMAEALVIGGLAAKAASNPVGWAFLAGEALGGVTMMAVAKSMKWIGQGINAIAKADLPDNAKIRETMTKVGEVVTELSEVGKNLPRDAIGNANRAIGIDKVMKSALHVGELLPQIAKLKISNKQVAAAKKALVGKDGKGGIKAALSSVKDAIAEAFGEEIVSSKQYGTKGKVKRSKRQVFDQKSLDSATQAVSSVEGMMSSVNGIVDSFKTFAGKFKELPKGETLTSIGERVSEVVSSVGNIADSFRVQKGVMEDVGDPTEVLDNINNGMIGLQRVLESVRKIDEIAKGNAKENQGEINISDTVRRITTGLNGVFQDIKAITPQMISLDTFTMTLQRSMQNLSKAVQSMRTMGEGGAVPDIGGQIRSIVSSLAAGLGNIAGAQASVTMLNTLATTLNSAVSQIRFAFNQLNSVETFDVSGFTANISSALQSINSTQVDVSGLVNKLTTAANQIRRAWNKLKSAYRAIKSMSKSITISVSVDVGGAVAALNSAASKLRAAWANLNSAKSGGGGGGGGAGGGGGGAFHTGGLVNGMGRPIYRAKGGGVWMEPKGTDTVPAMLTPGEYVQNKKAVDFFGVKFMQRLNHLDLEGALRNVSRRASRTLSQSGGRAVINNINNRTNNARVNQTIYTNNENFTFRRANRFVGAL